MGTPESPQPQEPKDEVVVEKLKCVFFLEIDCTVRQEMAKKVGPRALEKYFQPLDKGSDEKQFIMKYVGAMKDMLGTLISEFNELSRFCELCPIRSALRIKKEAEIMNELVKTSSTPAATTSS